MMIPSLHPRSGTVLLIAVLAALLSGCATRTTAPAADNAAATSLSLLESQLFDVIESMQELAEDARQPQADVRDIQRRFQAISNDFAAIIARNPRHLEARLLYGKFLSDYGDSDGARDQFLVAAQIDPQIGVIHQQLGTLFAEEGDYTRALAYHLNAIQLEPDIAIYHFGLGQLLTAFRQDLIADGVFSASRIDASILQSFDAARRIEPDNSTFQLRYGEAFYDVDDPDWQAALSHWQELASREALSPVMRDILRLHQARALTQLGRTQEAQSLLDSIDSEALKHAKPE